MALDKLGDAETLGFIAMVYTLVETIVVSRWILLVEGERIDLRKSPVSIIRIGSRLNLLASTIIN